MGNTTNQYERHEDDEQQQRIVIERDFRLLLGQLDFSSDLSKKKKIFFNQKHRKVSASSSSTITSPPSDPSSVVSSICLEIPTSPFDSNDLDLHTFHRYLLDQDVDGKELSHLFKMPQQDKSLSKSLPTVELAAIFYDQPTVTTAENHQDLTIETISYLDENDLQKKFEALTKQDIITIYSSKSKVYILQRKNKSSTNNNHNYVFIRSATMFKTILDNFEWLHPFLNYSNLGYRLCGLVPLINTPCDNSVTIYWLFEQMEKCTFDYCLIEYQLKSFSFDHWTSFLNQMFKQEWKLVSTFECHQKKKTNDQICYLLFFQRRKSELN